MKRSCKFVIWFRRQWKAILLILFGVALLVGNICVLFCVPEDNGQGAWLTLFSGWVSGIATAMLGGLALWQNKRFSCESKKRSLIQEASYFINEEQEAFLQFFELGKLYSLADEIDTALSEQDNKKRLFNQVKLLNVEEELTKNVMLFQMILSKSLICKDEIILLDSLLDKFVMDFHKFQDYEETDATGLKKQCYSVIKEFINSALKLQHSILVRYQQFNFRLLGEEKSKIILKIESDIFEEKKAISAYFEESIRKYENG